MARGTIQQAADQQAAQSTAIRTREVVRQIKVEVTQEERDQNAKRLAEATKAALMLEEQRRDTVADFNSRIKKQKGVAEEASEIVLDGLRSREIRCVQEFDDAKGLTRVVRKDTLEEIEKWRAMTEDERQLAVPGTDDEPEGGNGTGEEGEES